VDPLSDMLTRIRNSLAVGKRELSLPYSKQKHALAKLLEKNEWIEGSSVEESNPPDSKPSPRNKALKLVLKYNNDTGRPVIHGLKRVSKPGQRIYTGVGEIARFRTGLGATIISTPKGLMTDSEARKEKVGGEVICQIW